MPTNLGFLIHKLNLYYLTMKKGIPFDELDESAPVLSYVEDPGIPRQFKRVPIYDDRGHLVGYHQPFFNPKVLPSEDEIVVSTTYDPTNPINSARYAKDLQSMLQADGFQGTPHESPMELADKVKSFMSDNDEK